MPGTFPDALLLAAGGSVDLTPDRPVALAGFRGRTGPFEHVHDRLEANVVLLAQGEERVALVSCDLLYVGEDLRRAVLAGLPGILSPQGLFIGASHTHFGPMTQPRMPVLGAVDPGYVEEVARRIVACVLAATGRLEPAHLSVSARPAPSGWAVNRRLVRLRIGRQGPSREAGMGPNPEGVLDSGVRILRVDSAAGKPLAVAWNAACHPTAFPAASSVSAEYPGMVRAAVRSALGAGVPVAFFQGFSGDVRAPFQGSTRSAAGLLRRMLQGPTFRDPTEAEHAAWAGRLAEVVLEGVQGAGPPLRPRLGSGRATLPLQALAPGADPGALVCAHVVELSPEAAVVGLSAEPLAGLRRPVERALPAPWLMTVGYLGQVDAYLPSDGDLPAGGYEVRGFREAFGMRGTFREGIDAEVERLVRRATPGAERGAPGPDAVRGPV